MSKADEQFTEEQQKQRDKLLLELLKTPPQPRPKRERPSKKPSRSRASRASAKKL